MAKNNNELTWEGVKIPFPEEMVNALIEARGRNVDMAFGIGRVVDVAIEQALEELQRRGVVREGDERARAGVVGKIIAHTARLVGLSSSRVRRFYDLWRAFGEGGSSGVVYTDHPAVGLSHWEAALPFRDDGDFLEEYLAIVEVEPQVKASEAVRKARVALGWNGAAEEGGNGRAHLDIGRLLERISQGVADEEELDALREALRSSDKRAFVVEAIMKALTILDHTVPALAGLDGVEEEQIETAQSVLARLRALLVTLLPA